MTSLLKWQQDQNKVTPVKEKEVDKSSQYSIQFQLMEMSVQLSGKAFFTYERGKT